MRWFEFSKNFNSLNWNRNNPKGTWWKCIPEQKIRIYFFPWVLAMLGCSNYSFITKWFMKTKGWHNGWPKGAEQHRKTEMPLSWRMYSYVCNLNVKLKCKHCDWKYSKHHRQLPSDECGGIVQTIWSHPSFWTALSGKLFRQKWALATLPACIGFLLKERLLHGEKTIGRRPAVFFYSPK